MVHDLEQYGAWRHGVAASLDRYQAGADAAELTDAATAQRIARTPARRAGDTLSVAFVAEFSRGKSELINAMFFADYGQRILPSAARRTTMCPTELMYDPAYPPCLRLLPIDTRAANLSTSDDCDDRDAWTMLPLAQDAGSIHETLKQVSLTRRVSVAEARRYGLYDALDADVAAMPDADGMIEISLWRHAIINFPHPLLKQGPVILDTSGLNAIGAEPELTLNLIPNAHAVLFILTSETGVTKSDIDVWRTHIGAGAGPIVVLDKIDAMWDELQSDARNDAEIARQQANAADFLSLKPRQVHPVSAQKALVAKISGDLALLEKSRLGAPEAALFNQLIPARQDIIRQQLADDMAQLVGGALQHARHGHRAAGNRRRAPCHAGEPLCHRHARAGQVFFDQAKVNLDESARKIAEIGAMMASMSRKFSAQHGLPMALSLDRYRRDIDAIEAIEAVYVQQTGHDGGHMKIAT